MKNITEQFTVESPEVSEGGDIQQEVDGVHPPVPGVGTQRHKVSILSQADVLDDEDWQGEENVGSCQHDQSNLDLTEWNLSLVGQNLLLILLQLKNHSNDDVTDQYQEERYKEDDTEEETSWKVSILSLAVDHFTLAMSHIISKCSKVE